MVLEVLILFLLIIGICVIHYRGALHEFQILQKDYSPSNRWSDFLSEQLPLVIRNLPPSWLGNWSARRTEMKKWSVSLRAKNGKMLRTSWAHWLQFPTAPIENQIEMSRNSKLDITIQNWADFRRWFWIPTGSPLPFILSTNPENAFVGLKKTTAAATAIVSTDGSPLELWISHEGGIPHHLIQDLRNQNPWIQSTNEIPGVEDVKFIEMRLRPGNAVVLPCHWWYAIRRMEGDSNSLSWFWIHEFHTPISYVATKLQPK